MPDVLVHTGTFGSAGTVKLYLSYSTSTNNSNNTSTVTCGMYIVVSSGSNIGPWTDWAGSYCGTTSNTFGGGIGNVSGTHWLTSGNTFTVYHNSDGSGSAGIQWKWGVRSSWANTWEPSGTHWIGLPTIPKAAKITSAENFNDEGNPTIKYSNPAGNGATTLQACLSFDGYTIEVPYRDIPKTGSSYKFNLTETEREALRAGCADAKSKSIYFYVKSVINGKQELTKIEKTFTVVNAEPEINPTVVDIDEAAIAITGDNTKLIKYFSDAKCLMNYTLKKGATIGDITVKHNGITKYNNESYWYDVESNVFEFTLTDSRGNTVSKTITAPLFDYVKLTCNLEATISTKGTGYLTINGNFFNRTFGDTNNTLTLEYRYNDGAWTTFTPSINGDSYYASIDIPGLDYRSTYKFEARATDKAMSVSGLFYARALPVFDWGENDFNFNVPITIEGRGYGTNKILWEGALPMGSNQTINLIGGAISEQPHGIVLIFTGFDEPTPLDQSVNTFFVSKEQVNLLGGAGHTFILGYNATLAKFGAKYLYFTDTQISGHSGNTTKGTATPGFEIDNTYWCLRYVIGV